MNIVSHLKQRERVHVKHKHDGDYVVMVTLDDGETIYLPKSLVDAINDVVGNARIDLTRIDGQIHD